MSERTGRYFIGYALTEPEKGMVDALREKIAAEFGVKDALLMPPHLTLFYPFETQDLGRLPEELKRLAQECTPFAVPVTKYAAFEQSVWFLDPVQDPAILSLREGVAAAVKEAVGIADKEGRNEPHFHITLAYKDVSPEAHRHIGEFLKTKPLPISGVVIDNVTLFRWKGAGNGWETLETFPFSASPSS